MNFRGWEDYGMDLDAPHSTLNIAVAFLSKGLAVFNAEELDTSLKDLPLLEPGNMGGISIQEAVEVS